MLNEEEVINGGVAVAVEEMVEVQTPVREHKIIEVKGGKIYAFLKRFEDIVASLVAITILFIPMLIIGLLVKLTSKGPVFFKDKRVGKGGKEITVLKFRSMYIDAESNIDKYLTEEQKIIWVRERKLDPDPRITKVGRFLRKTSLDELPQLINIFKGDLSIVGPRPITKSEMDLNYTEYEQSILTLARPGLTGYWQVYGRSNIDYQSGQRQKLELEYYSKRGFWFDIGIIFKTIPAVLKSKGAH